MLTTLRNYHLQVENVDWIIVVMNNWPNESYANCKPILDLKQYFKKKEFLAKENYKNNFFLKNYKLIMINIVGLGRVCVGVVGAKNLRYN
jgi:hypothetical protein